MQRRLAPVLPLLALTLAVSAACSSGSDGTSPAPTATVTDLPGGGAGGDEQGDDEGAQVPPQAQPAPESCTAIALVEGASVTSDELAACLADHMRWAGGGHQELRSGGTATSVDWIITADGMSALVDREEGGRVAFTPSHGWQETDGQWVEGDAGGDDVAQRVARGVDILRSSLEPTFLETMIRLAPGYTVGGREEVELEDGTTTSLWPIRSTGPFETFASSTTDELVVWTAEPGPTARLDILSTTEGLGQGTSTTYYTRWGERLDLDELEELLER